MKRTFLLLITGLLVGLFAAPSLRAQAIKIDGGIALDYVCINTSTQAIGCGALTTSQLQLTIYAGSTVSTTLTTELTCASSGVTCVARGSNAFNIALTSVHINQAGIFTLLASAPGIYPDRTRYQIDEAAGYDLVHNGDVYDGAAGEASILSAINGVSNTLGDPTPLTITGMLNTTLSSLTTVMNKTNSLTFTVAGLVDANVIDWKSAVAPAMTGDSFARLGAPAGASVSADIAAVKADTAAVKTKTDFLPSATAGAAGGVFIAGANAATTVNFTGNLSGSVGSVTNNVGGNLLGNVNGTVVGTTGGMTAAGWAGAFSVNTGTNYAGSVAGSLVKETADNAGGSALTVAAIAAGVWDLLTTGHGTASSFGGVVLALSAAGDPLNSTVPGAYPAGTAGFVIGSNLNATISSRASQTSVDTVDDFVDTEVAAILAKVNGLTYTVANQVDVNVIDWKSAVAPAMTGDAFARIGATGSGLTSLASQTSVDTIDDFIDTEVATILGKVNPLPTDPADQSLLLAAINSRSSYDFKRSVGFTWGMAFTDAQGNPVTTGTPTCTRAIDQVTTFAAGGVTATAVNSFGYSLLTVSAADMNGDNFTFVRCTGVGRGFQYIFRIEQP